MSNLLGNLWGNLKFSNSLILRDEGQEVYSKSLLFNPVNALEVAFLFH